MSESLLAEVVRWLDGLGLVAPGQAIRVRKPFQQLDLLNVGSYLVSCYTQGLAAGDFSLFLFHHSEVVAVAHKRQGSWRTQPEHLVLLQTWARSRHERAAAE